MKPSMINNNSINQTYKQGVYNWLIDAKKQTCPDLTLAQQWLRDRQMILNSIIRKERKEQDKMSTLSKLRKGSFFRFPGKKKVYVYSGRIAKRFSYFDFENVNNYHYTTTDRQVGFGFEF